MEYNLFLDDDSDESDDLILELMSLKPDRSGFDTDYNNVFSCARSRDASDDESEFEENVVTFTLEINERSKIEINYITLVSDSED